MPNPKQSEEVEAPAKQFDTPAKVLPFHRVINPQDPERWWRYEVKDETPLGLAYDRGQLSSGRREYTAEDRYGAGAIYRGIYDGVNAPTCAGTKFERVGSSSGSEARTSERLTIARDLRKKVKDRMSRDNFYIVEEFCGAGSHASAAVRARFAGFEKAVWNTVCIALDDLLDAVVALGLGKVSRGEND